MSKEYLEILAVQVLIFRNALLLNGANEETADKLTSVYIGTCLSIAVQGQYKRRNKNGSWYKRDIMLEMLTSLGL